MVEYTEELKKECLKQLEFYFSEYNLPFDKFLRSTIKENDGWVPLITIGKFNRMKKFEIEENLNIIKKLIENDSKILKINDELKIQRINELNFDELKEKRKEQNDRTLIISGFDHQKINQENFEENFDKLDKFFNKFNKKINQIRLQKGKGCRFNGTIFIEFEKLEDSQEFLKEFGKDREDNLEPLSYEGMKLDVESKKSYFDKFTPKKRNNNNHKGKFNKKREEKTEDKKEEEKTE